MKVTPVILSGGGGTRLWPLSRPARPKQFLALVGEETMFRMTLARVADRTRFDAPIIVGNAAHVDLIEEQLAQAGIDDARIIYEPSARNTAPAIALAALAAQTPHAWLLVMPSDHVIADLAAFHEAIAAALPLAAQGWLVTFGIEPTAPETGYGYIRTGDPLSGSVARVASFVEKPDMQKAQAMLDSGDHVWNGGIFLFRADSYLDHLSSLAPDMHSATQQAMAKASIDGRAIRPDASAFAASPANSIDYAVMEKAEHVAVVPVSMGWSDVGSWDALYESSARNGEGNVVNGNVRLIDSRNNLAHAEKIRISLLGVEDLIVVASEGEVLIMKRGESQRIKQFEN